MALAAMALGANAQQKLYLTIDGVKKTATLGTILTTLSVKTAKSTPTAKVGSHLLMVIGFSKTGSSEISLNEGKSLGPSSASVSASKAAIVGSKS